MILKLFGPGNVLLPVAALAVAAPTSASADNFDYEIGADYDAANQSTRSVVSLDPLIPGGTIAIRSKLDSDNLDLFGTWYFSGVTSNDGPRSRAAFLARASSVSLRYSGLDGDATIRVDSIDPTVPSDTTRSSTSGDTFSATARYVWAGSGWYVLGSLATASLEFDNGDVDADAYTVGIGKYFASRTAIDLSVLHEDSTSSGSIFQSNSSGSAARLALMHVGDLGSTWQYGTDVALSTDGAGDSDGSFDLKLSLYPTRSVAFGLDIAGQLENFGDGAVRYETFISWFPRESFTINARYGWVTIDEPAGIDTDNDSAGVGFRFRF